MNDVGFSERLLSATTKQAMTFYPDFSSRPAKIVVDLNRLDLNLKTIKEKVGSSKVMAVIKANAYGHGLLECAKRLEASAVDYFGVALVEEGAFLRRSGITKPILVFGAIAEPQIEQFLAHDLEITASSISKLHAVDQLAAKKEITAKIHLKIDTGMGRIGVRPQSAFKLIDDCCSLKNVKIVGIYSHFSCADEIDLSYSKFQLEAFSPLVDYAKNALGSEILAHISNSAAIAQLPEANLDMVRPGLSLYGITAAPFLKDKLDLKPIMSLTSQVSFFKVVEAGTSVSYARTWRANEDTHVVTVPVGYGDGYQRALSNKASVLIRGRRHPLIGRVCMDQMMISLGDSEAFNGETVTLIGSDGAESIGVEELAELAGTVPHEILSNLNLRLCREFRN